MQVNPSKDVALKTTYNKAVAVAVAVACLDLPPPVRSRLGPCKLPRGKLEARLESGGW